LVKIRLQRHGRKRAPYYHIVVADSRKKRDGRIIEDLGRYNPVTETTRVLVNTDRAMYWLKNGAQPTDTVEGILRKEGIYYRLHLERWNKTPEEIEATIAAWKQDRDSSANKVLTSIEQKKAALKAEEDAVKAAQAEAVAAAAKKAEEEKAAKAKEKEAAEKEAAEKEAAEKAATAADAESTEVVAEETAEAESPKVEAASEVADAEAATETTEADAEVAEEKKD
jgi:small subunit ribosomal protein S16